MPKITQLSPAAALDGSELVAIVQAGVTVKATVQDIADLTAAISSAVISVNTQVGIVVLAAADVGADAAGTAAAAIVVHDTSPAAHGGVEVAFAAHDGAGGTTHPEATNIAAGFAPALSGNATDYLAGDGSFTPLPSAGGIVATQRIDSTDSPYAPNNDDQVILVDATVAVIVNLPQIAAGNDGLLLYIKMTTGAAGVTINAYNVADGTDKIDGANSYALAAIYESLTIVASYDAGGNSFWSIL